MLFVVTDHGEANQGCGRDAAGQSTCCTSRPIISNTSGLYLEVAVCNATNLNKQLPFNGRAYTNKFHVHQSATGVQRAALHR
jgi:hypothetical protein